MLICVSISFITIKYCPFQFKLHRIYNYKLKNIIDLAVFFGFCLLFLVFYFFYLVFD